MGWRGGSVDKRLGTVYIPAAVAVAVAATALSPLSPGRKIWLAAILILLIPIHWDLRDGGLLSRFFYSRSTSYQVRNFATVTAAFLLVTVVLAALDGFSGPLMMLYFAPIVLAATRGGGNMAAAVGAVATSGLAIFLLLRAQIEQTSVDQQSLIAAGLILPLAVISGVIADRLRRAAVDLSALYETGRAISSTLDLQDVFKVLLNIISMDLAPDVAAIFLVDRDSETLTMQAQAGLVGSDRNQRETLGHGLVGKVAASGDFVYVSEPNRRYRLGFAPNMGSIIAVPAKVADEVIGVLVVARKAPHAYGFENIRFLEALASQSAIAIQNAKLYRQTKEWASIDGLTGIYNYRYFTEKLDQEWKRAVRYDNPLSIIMIDVDLFKLVNDTYGHLVGDTVLRDLAILMKSYTREIDSVARYGGEEFAVILPETHYQDAYTVAEKLRLAVSQAQFRSGDPTSGPIRLTISLGVANYPTTASTKSDLVYQADQALYQAKTRRNTLASPLDLSVSLDLDPKALDG